MSLSLRYPHAPSGRTRKRSHGFRHARSRSTSAFASTSLVVRFAHSARTLAMLVRSPARPETGTRFMRCRYRSISARSLWSHAGTLARLTPRSLSLHLGFRLDVALPTLPLVACATLTPLSRSLCSYARPHALRRHAVYAVSLRSISAHSLCSYARSRPRSLWSHGLLSGVASAPDKKSQGLIIS